MEEKSLLRKIEYLSRKIGELKEDSNIKISSAMFSNYIPNTGRKYWQGHRRVDNRSKLQVFDHVVPMTQSSKYQYQKASSSTFNLSRYSSIPINETSDRKPTTSHKKPASNMYVNPNFKSSKTSQTPLLQTKTHSVDAQSGRQSSVVSTNKSATMVGSTTKSSHIMLSKLADSGTTTGTLNAVQIPDAKRPIHVNPAVVSSKNTLSFSVENPKTSVHVNPKVIARLKSELKREKPCPKVSNTSFNKYKKPVDSINKSLVAISRTKLVQRGRLVLNRSLSSQHPGIQRSRIMSTAKPSTPLLNIVKSVRSKYKYIRKSSSTPTGCNVRSLSKGSPFMKTKFKLDRREQKPAKQLRRVQTYSVMYESGKRNRHHESNLQGVMLHKKLSSDCKSPYRNRVWGAGSLQPQKVIITDRKLLKIGSSPNVKRSLKIVNNRTPSSSTLVRIGGILYKTSRTKLTRTGIPKAKYAKSKLSDHTSIAKKSPRVLFGGHVVNVRGNKFVMDSTGRTLRRVSSRDQTSRGALKRIDIGGATFIQKSHNVLIRTNTHHVRSILSQAKQKSIDLLTKKLRKNNTVCKFYRRFGKCFRKEAGRCPCVHDTKYVAICKSFLSGECKKDGCLLSHELIPEKMPTCKYFLQACCTRENCTYLHVKLNAKAPLCIAFLQGYCPDGTRCRKWHFYICPQFDKTGKCPKGKYCPFPHQSRKYAELNRDHLELNVGHIMEMYEARVKDQQEGKTKSEKIVRYFSFNSDKIHDQDKSEGGDTSSCDDMLGHRDSGEDSSLVGKSSEDEISSDEESVPKRQAIGILPSYIPFH